VPGFLRDFASRGTHFDEIMLVDVEDELATA
jgi:hypothetical protein